MKGRIVSYRRGRHTQNERQIIVEVQGVKDRKAAQSLCGKKVRIGEFQGKVIAAHGNKGRVRVLMEKPIPGQLLGGEVEIG